MQYEIKRKNIVKFNTQKRKRQLNFFTFHNTLKHLYIGHLISDIL